MFWLLTSYWAQAKERQTNVLADINSLGPLKSCWIFITYVTLYYIWYFGGGREEFTRVPFRKKNFSSNTAVTRPEVWKQCPVHVICCISGWRALRITLTAAQNPGNYRNSQAVGKAFTRSGFTPAIHSHRFCTISDVTMCAPEKNWLQNTVSAGGLWGNESPQLLQQQGCQTHQNLLLGSFTKTHCASTFYPSVLFSFHSSTSGLSAPMHLSPFSVELPCTPLPLPQLLLLTRKRLPGTTVNLIREGKIAMQNSPHCRVSPETGRGQGENLLFWILRCLCYFLSYEWLGYNKSFKVWF